MTPYEFEIKDITVDKVLESTEVEVNSDSKKINFIQIMDVEMITTNIQIKWRCYKQK